MQQPTSVVSLNMHSAYKSQRRSSCNVRVYYTVNGRFQSLEVTPASTAGLLHVFPQRELGWAVQCTAVERLVYYNTQWHKPVADPGTGGTGGPPPPIPWAAERTIFQKVKAKQWGLAGRVVNIDYRYR
jgi:hypothetical protein